MIDHRSDLAEVRKRGVDQLEGLINLFSDLGTSQDDLAAHEDKQDNLGLDHAVDETREQLRLIGAEVVMLRRKTFQTDRELDVARADDVLDLEIGELGIEAQFLDNPSVLARSKLRVIFRFGTSDNHLARSKDESGRLGIANTHDNSRESLRVVLSVASVQRDSLEVQTTIKIDSSDDVSFETC